MDSLKKALGVKNQSVRGGFFEIFSNCAVATLHKMGAGLFFLQN